MRGWIGSRLQILPLLLQLVEKVNWLKWGWLNYCNGQCCCMEHLCSSFMGWFLSTVHDLSRAGSLEKETWQWFLWNIEGCSEMVTKIFCQKQLTEMEAAMWQVPGGHWKIAQFIPGSTMHFKYQPYLFNTASWITLHENCKSVFAQETRVAWSSWGKRDRYCTCFEEGKWHKKDLFGFEVSDTNQEL